jgi:hypothetical protein
MKGFITLFILFVFCTTTALSQTDSVNQLSLNEYISIVRQYHPVVKQMTLQVQRAKAGVLSSRGFFDPAFYTNTERKSFTGELYYSYINP